MHLESLTITNYRKFGSTDNTVYFVEPKSVVVEEGSENKPSVVAPSTTLIIGKNNSGKTTIVNALKLLCGNTQPTSSDFNISYLRSMFSKYKNCFDAGESFDNLDTPRLEFILSVKVKFNENDLMTNLSQFIPISEPTTAGTPVTAKIKVKIELCEESSFRNSVLEIFRNVQFDNDNKKFQSFYNLLSKSANSEQSTSNLYRAYFENLSGLAIEQFSLKELIKIREIKANRHLKSGVLSDIFNKIVGFQFSNDKSARFDLDSRIESINDDITSSVDAKSHNISTVLNEIESSSHVNLNLVGNVTYDSLIKGLIKYNFIDGGDYIPEDQFGLGYINLLNIIGEVIHFVDSYQNKSHLSCINLLFIEEPEAFMHPQMQEFFITRIDNAVTKALEIANTASDTPKILQCQLAITTHSSHIVNSKIHSSNSFNSINYLTSEKKCTKVINLNDDTVIGDQDLEALKFLKKHIKYKVSELFFSDAIIFVEGITEETLLNYFLDKHPILKAKHVSVFNINGAHGKLYLPLAKALSIPSLIVTDLDIHREKCEKGEAHKKDKSCMICGQQARSEKEAFIVGSEPSYVQLTTLHGRSTTNSTIIEFNKKYRQKTESEANKIEDIDYFEDDNLLVVFQKDSIEGQFATSLEEALILTNYNNDIINSTIQSCKPSIYHSVLTSNGQESRENLINNSYKLQKKLSDSKSDFSNELLFKLISSDENIPQLPTYLINGLDWLARKLTHATTQLNSPVDTQSSEELQNAEVETDDAQ